MDTTLSPALLRLAADLLDMAADTYANHGCNDYDLSPAFTDKEREALAALMNRSNFSDRPPETWPASDVVDPKDLHRGCADFVAMAALAFGLRKMAE